MDIKESIKKLIETSTDLLKKLEADANTDDHDDSSNDIEIFEKIIEDSKTIATQWKSKSKRPKRQPNGGIQSSSGDDSRSSTIKLVPIEKLMQKCATVVLDKTPMIELSDSENELLIPVQIAKPKPSNINKTSKASILKSVFSPVKENATQNHTIKKNASSKEDRRCRVNLKRFDLNKLVKSNGLELMPTVNYTATTTQTPKSSTTVRSIFFQIYQIECQRCLIWFIHRKPFASMTHRKKEKKKKKKKKRTSKLPNPIALMVRKPFQKSLQNIYVN